MPEFERYPMRMTHPGHQPAILGRSAGEGQPEKFPAVIVHNEDDEQWHISRGYVPSGSPDGFAQAVAPKPAGYQFLEYPKMMTIAGKSYTVNSKEEEDALCGNNDVLEKPQMEAKPETKEIQPVKRKRGRPKGSKNKVKRVSSAQ